MNRKIAISALVLLLAAGSASATDVTFGFSAPVAGTTTWTENASYGTTVNATAGASASENTAHSVSRTKTNRVLEIDGAGRIDSVLVTYSSATHGDVAGRSYVVTPHGVTYSGGGAPAASEAEFVRDDNSGFGQFRALERIFGGNTFTIGSTFQPNRKDAEELLNVAEGLRLRSLALTLRSVSGGVARFDVSMSIESDPKEKKGGKAVTGNMTMTLNGILDVTVATSRPVLLDVAGNITASTKKPNGARAGDATGTTTINVAYGF